MQGEMLVLLRLAEAPLEIGRDLKLGGFFRAKARSGPGFKLRAFSSASSARAFQS
jgi:hypothetical protein